MARDDAVERRAGALEVGGGDQRQGDRLGEADPDQRVGDQPSLALAQGQRADLAVGVGQRATDPVETDAPRHFLHQVDLAVEVGAEGGNHRDNGVGVVGLGILEFDPERGQRGPDVFVVEAGAEHRVHPAGPQADALAFDRRRIHVSDVGGDLCAGHLHQQLHRPLGVALDRIGIEATLEARARLAAQLEPLGAAGDAHALEVGRLEEDLGGGLRHLGGGPAHDPGDGLRCALGVADEEILTGELTLDAVERGDPLTGVGQAHDDAAPREPRQVEGVQRLVALEQHVVGDVDHVADRTHARLHQPLRHPRGRRPHRDARDPAEVAGAAVRVVDHHGDVTRHLGIARRVRLRHPEVEAEVRGQLARQSDDAHRVGAVGRDGEVEDGVVEPEEVAHVGPELARRIEGEDAGVVVAQAQLLGRAEHAVGHLAADLAPLQLETAGQRRPGRRVRHDHPRHHVGRSAHHAGLRRAGAHVDERELVGIGVLHDVEHARPRSPR